MTITVVQEPSSALPDYARVPSVFEVRAVLHVATPAIEGDACGLSEHVIATPYLKDYDAIVGERPTSWPDRFDLSAWAFFVAYADGARVGGAAVAMNAPAVTLLEGRSDLALLWDIRVAPSTRRSGVGAHLLRAVERWASEHGARSLKVETQDINVPACRFDERNNFHLRIVHSGAYPSLPDETQLLWYKDLIQIDLGGSS